jgi:hypothetical protein
MRDFTLQAYMRLIDKLRYSGLSIYGVADWLIKKPQMGTLIRHDVDRKIKNALEMAKAEAAIRRYLFQDRKKYFYQILRNLGFLKRKSFSLKT